MVADTIYDVTINQREYCIVGDNLTIPTLYSDAPQWLKDLVDVVVEVGVETNNQDLLNQTQDLINALANTTVPLNQFSQSILTLTTEDSRLNSVIETLNSNLTSGLNSANAQIIDIKQTYVSKEEASATVVNAITAQLDNGVLDNVATIGHVSTVLATETQARALDYTSLESTIAGESEAQAQATQTIRTYVGIDEAGAGTGTGLSAYLEASDGTIGGADSQVTNDIRVSAEGVEAKWAYNSVVNINGVYKKSGFGLTTNYTSGSGTEANPYVSEFWVDATRFKFTNSNQTGRTSPFTIDASGSAPKVYFNGVVNFSNTDMSQYDNNNSQPTVGCKINHASFSGSSSGEVFVCGYTNGVLSNTNGFIFIKGIKTVLPKTYVNPNGIGVGYIVYDTENNNYKAVKKIEGVWKTFANGSVDTHNLYGIGTIENSANELVKSAEMWTYSAHLDTLPDPTDSEAKRRVLPEGVAHAINTNSTTINGSKITTGSIYAAQIATGTLTADQINVNSLFAQDITATGTISGTTLNGGTINGNTINGGSIIGSTIRNSANSFSVSVNGAINGASYNGMRFKIGSFESSVDGDQVVYFSSSEGRDYSALDGSYTSPGVFSGYFTKCIGVSIAHLGPSTASRDANIPKMEEATGSKFIFNRDDGYDGTEYFSYIAWGY